MAVPAAFVATGAPVREAGLRLGAWLTVALAVKVVALKPVAPPTPVVVRFTVAPGEPLPAQA